MILKYFKNLWISIQYKARQRDHISFSHYYVVFRSIIWNYLSLLAELLMTHFL